MITAYILNMVAVIRIIMIPILFEQVGLSFEQFSREGGQKR